MKNLIFILVFMTLNSCSKHTVHKSKELSRNYTTIKFSSSKKPYIAKEQVGGEQINVTKIIAQAKEVYLIDVKNNNEGLKLYIEGPSLETQTYKDKPLKKKILSASETDITLSLTSHPESSE